MPNRFQEAPGSPGSLITGSPWTNKKRHNDSAESPGSIECTLSKEGNAMPLGETKYTVGGVNLSAIRNRNEIRVVKALREVLKHCETPLPPQTVMDIYASALNELPARYTQTGTIVLGDPVREETIAIAVKNAIDRVLAHPKS